MTRPRSLPYMINPLKSLVVLAIAFAKKALQSEAPARCIRGGSPAALAAGRRQRARLLANPIEEPSEPGTALTAKL